MNISKNLSPRLQNVYKPNTLASVQIADMEMEFFFFF